MTARFAGSRTLDERRRRWLATNESERLVSPAAEKPPQLPEEEAAPREVNLRQFPIRKVISPKAWKIALACLAVGMMGIMILATGARGWPDPQMMGPGWLRLIDANGGNLARMFQAGLLMAGGQLALLIWWGRSQSLRDFEGQYRIWRWAGLVMLFAGWGLMGDWHWALSDTACWLWSARFPGREVVCWMLPGVLLAGILWRRLSADMRECKTSFCLLWLAAIACLAACVFRLGIDRTGWDLPVKQLSGASLQMLSCVSLFASLLVHARFVIHVCAEPPERRLSVWARGFAVFKGLIQKLPRPRLTFPHWKRNLQKPEKKAAKKDKASDKGNTQKTQPDGESLKATSTKTAPNKTTSGKPAKAQPSEREVVISSTKADSTSAATEAKPNLPPKTSPVVEVPKPAAPQPAAAARKPLTASSRPAETKLATPQTKPPEADDDDDDANEPQLRLDNPLDPNQLKGLSKKERRRLRKQHKESQRNG
jgi:hypothetical protein